MWPLSAEVLMQGQMQRQEQEVMLGCGVINKMTSLGMPASYRSA